MFATTDFEVQLAEVKRLSLLDPQQILAFAIHTYSPDIAIAFSGAEDVVLIDMAVKLERPFRVFCLDTGRLHAETYRFLEQVREDYAINLEVLFPQPDAVEKLVRHKGLFSFYRDGHAECCAVRKVEPLRRMLTQVQAWVTGQRCDQSPATRSHVPVMQFDDIFSSQEHLLVKFNPLAKWSSAQVWTYIHEHGVPYNSLRDRGFVSIGCEPCTRPIHPGQHEREGRWWWEGPAKKECGLHGASLQKQT